jgi:hypothetical protein
MNLDLFFILNTKLIDILLQRVYQAREYKCEHFNQNGIRCNGTPKQVN